MDNMGNLKHSGEATGRGNMAHAKWMLIDKNENSSRRLLRQK